MELTDFQRRARSMVQNAWEGGARRVLCVAPTGFGKTILAGAMIQDELRRGGRVVVIAPWRELVPQTAAKLLRFGLAPGMIMAGEPSHPSRHVQVASVETLARRAIPRATLVIVDEAHRYATERRVDLLQSWPDARVLGLTATPYRRGTGGLRRLFDELVVAATPRQLIDAGYLARPVVYGADPDEVRAVPVRRTGDFDPEALDRIVTRPRWVGDTVAEYRRLAAGRLALVFGTSVEHARRLRDEFEAAGFDAGHVQAETPAHERQSILRRFRAGELRVLTNCGVLTEGFDAPEVSCVILKPTASLGLYVQMVGRGLRTAPGKSDCIVLDPGGNAARFGLPDAEIGFTLDGVDERAGPHVRYCHRCGAAIPAGIQRCARCSDATSSRLPNPRGARGPVVQVPGRLDAWVEDLDELERHVLNRARGTGYSATWAATEFRRLHGRPSRRLRARARVELEEMERTHGLGAAWLRAELAKL